MIDYLVLPNDMWQLIITLASPDNYFNIHGVCASFRRYLREVYKNNSALRENPDDVLSLIVFKQKFPLMGHTLCHTIIKGFNNPNSNDADNKYIIRALLQIEVSYNDTYISYMLWNFLHRNNEYEILEHISKSNTTFIYTKMLEVNQQREWTEREEKFFQYLIGCITSYHPLFINKFALQAINDRQINIFLKFYNTNKLSNLFKCLIKLVKQNDYETVEYLLDRNTYTKKSYKTLWKATNKDDEDMQDLILSYYQ